MSRDRISFRWLVLAAVAWAGLGLSAAAPGAQAQETPSTLVLVFDASGSMWGQVGGEAKITIARRVMGEVAGGLADSTKVALVAYGHRREGDCSDVETVLPLAPLDRSALTAAVEGLNPKGKTPITASAQQAIGLLEGRPAEAAAATVILVSDGIETCGGDPCAAVAEARESGVHFVLHVVGFGVEEGDVSQLECTAQAGGGLYFPASDAAELTAALETVFEAPPEPGGRLSVAAVADGEAVDAIVRVRPAGASGEKDVVAKGRTYTRAETNPRILAVEPGLYDVEVKAIAIEGASPVVFPGVEVPEEGIAERRADFSSGSLVVRVTRNGELSDATLRVYRAGTGEEVAAARTYTRENSNPTSFELAVGTYDLWIKALEVEGSPEMQLTGIAVTAGEPAELEGRFTSGTLVLGVTADGEPADAVVRVLGGGGQEVARGRTYTGPPSNPRTFVLEPGSYSVEVKPLDRERAPQELTVEVAAEAAIERSVEI